MRSGADTWLKLIGNPDGPFDIELSTEPGTVFKSRAPYPNLEIISIDSADVKHIVHQTVRAKAEIPGEDAKLDVVIGRLVAVLSGGEEIEIDRVAIPTESVVSEADITMCAACGKNIPLGGHVVVDGKAYHKLTCIRKEP